MPVLVAWQRERALGMFNAGQSVDAIARAFRVHRTTVFRLLRRVRRTGTTAPAPRSGRPRVTTRRQDNYIRTQHMRDRFRTAAMTARQTIGLHGRQVNDRTIRRRLSVHGIKARRPYRGPILTPRHRANRLRWAQQHLRWTRRQWGTVLFSDESRFNLSRADGRIRVWRRRGERFADCCTIQHNRWGGGGLMVWAGISLHRRTQLHFVNGRLNANTYIRDILTPTVIPYMRQHGGLFQQDNATPHRAQITMNHLTNNNVNVMDFPALSPDLAPIEHLWDELGRRVYGHVNPPQTLNALRNMLIAEWNAIPQQFIARVVLSMRRRCLATVQANGGHTRY